MLRGELDLAKSILQSLDRPKEVISRHRELTQKALRDEATLVTLQNQLKQFQLEQARASSPWELISTPTVLDKPVSPRRGRTMALGLLAGLVMGCASALLKDRRTGRIFTCNELLHSLPGSLLERLPNKDSKEIVENWQIPIQLLADGPLKGASTVALIPVGSIEPENLNNFKQILRKALGTERKVLVSSDLLTTRTYDTQLLVTSLGSATRKQVAHLREQLNLQGAPIAGWVLLDNSIDA